MYSLSSKAAAPSASVGCLHFCRFSYGGVGVVHIYCTRDSCRCVWLAHGSHTKLSAALFCSRYVLHFYKPSPEKDGVKETHCRHREPRLPGLTREERLLVAEVETCVCRAGPSCYRGSTHCSQAESPEAPVERGHPLSCVSHVSLRSGDSLRQWYSSELLQERLSTEPWRGISKCVSLLYYVIFVILKLILHLFYILKHNHLKSSLNYCLYRVYAVNLPCCVYKSRCSYYFYVELYTVVMYFIPLYFTGVVNIRVGTLAVIKALCTLVFLSNYN